jgi:PAS domain S-box-containing protein
MDSGSVENIEEYHIVLNKEGGFASVSSNFLDNMGYAEEALLGTALSNYVPQEDKSIIQNLINPKHEGKAQCIFKFRILDIISGNYLPLISFVNRNSEEGIHLVSTVSHSHEDIQQELLESKTKFDMLAKNLPGVLYLCNNDETFSMLFLNDQVERLTGYLKADFMTGSIDFVQLYHPEDKDNIFEIVEDALEQKQPFHLSYRLKTKDDRWIWIEEFGQGVYSNGSLKYIEGVLFDASRLKEAQIELDNYVNNLEKLVKERTNELNIKNEELTANLETLRETFNKLEHTQDQLIKSEKLASLGMLVAGIGHELNNPLNFIKNGSIALKSTLENKYEIDDEIKQLMAAIEEGSDRCASIVSSLKQFSRQGSSNDEECSIQTIIKNCLQILHNKLKGRITLKTKFAADNTILGNAGRLHQAFLNILNNAEQSMPKGGSLTIETISKQDKLIVTIFDTGYGISDDDLNKVFDPFFTTKAPGDGTGLGLSITHTILEEHNASIEFSSKVDEGTKCTITFIR